MIRISPPALEIVLLAGLLLSWTGGGGCAWGWNPDDDDTADQPADDDDGADDDGADDDGADDDSGDDDGADDDDSGDDDSGDDDSVPVASILHQTYFLDLSTFDITYPPGIGYAISPYLPSTFGSIFMVTQADDLAGTCTVRFGTGHDSQGDPDLDDWVQDLEVPTATPPCSWSNPTLTTGPVPEVDLVIPGEVTIHFINLSFSGDFLPDGSALTEVRLEGLIDSYSLDVWQEEPPGTGCAYLDKFGFPCVSCPTGPHQGEVYCADLVGESGTSPRLPGLTMVDVP